MLTLKNQNFDYFFTYKLNIFDLKTKNQNVDLKNLNFDPKKPNF